MNKPLVVQKYGGTSVGSIDRIKHVAQRIARIRKTGTQVVVVVSAMAGETDKLVKMAGQIYDNPEKREMDLLLSSGERISSALLTMALQSQGVSAISMTGRQIGLQTDSVHTRARIKQIDAKRARQALKDNNVIVVAGFQGINEQGDVTTLGRGGSDTSAVALAVALGASQCEIYTDVDGVYTADPRIVPKARKLDVISYDEMLEMASLGAKVLQIRCVEFAHKFQMPLVVKSSYKEGGKGTMTIMEKVAKKIHAVNVSADSKIAKISIVGAGMRSHSGVAAKIFKSLSKENINILMISTSEIKVSCIIEQKHTKVAVNALHKAFGLEKKVARKKSKTKKK